jgi:hypothetical protein
MNEESFKSLGITNEDLSHDWTAIPEVSDNEGFEFPIEDDEDDNDDDDDYNGDDGHYDEDNPNILEATSSSLLAKYLLRKLKTANMAVSALIALLELERVNITSSTDQKISADDSARDTTFSNNHDEAVATINTSVFDDTPIPMNFLEDHEPVDIDSITLVRSVTATSNEPLTTNVPSDNTIPSKREWFTSSGEDALCNLAPKKRLTSAGWQSENPLLTLDFIRSNDFAGVVDVVRTESDDIISISNKIIGNLDCEEIQDVNATSLKITKKTKKKKKAKRDIDFSTPIEPTEDDILFGRSGKKKIKAKRDIDFSTPIEPTEDDILFGRGGDINKHPGNVRFREKACELASSYVACGESKEKKYELSVVLVNCTEAENRRFLEKGPDGLWYKVLGNGKRIKASQALRDVKTQHMKT